MALYIGAAALVLLVSLPILAADSPPERIPPLRPPHPEIPPGFWEQHGWWVVLVGAVVLAAAAVAIWLLARPKPPVIVPPAAAARQALEPLRQQPETGAVLSLVSQILRRYVIQAFGLPAGEFTTTEFCRALGSHPRIGPELSAALSDFLRQCDQRKFAPTPPLPPLEAVGRALQLIQSAEARLALLRLAALAQPPKIMHSGSCQA